MSMGWRRATVDGHGWGRFTTGTALSRRASFGKGVRGKTTERPDEEREEGTVGGRCVGVTEGGE